jgi:hypothetical protein
VPRRATPKAQFATAVCSERSRPLNWAAGTPPLKAAALRLRGKADGLRLRRQYCIVPMLRVMVPLERGNSIDVTTTTSPCARSGNKIAFSVLGLHLVFSFFGLTPLFSLCKFLISIFALSLHPAEEEPSFSPA